MPPAGETTGAPAALLADSDVIYVCTYDSGNVAPSQTINTGSQHMAVIPHPFDAFPVANVLRYSYEALSGNSASGCDVRASFTDLGISGGPYEHLFSHFFIAFYDDFVFASTAANTASSGGISNPKDGGGDANSHSVKLPGGFAGMNTATSRSYPGGGAADPPCQTQTSAGWSVRNFLAELSGSETQVRPAMYSYMGQSLSGNTCSSGGAGTDVKTTSFLFQRGLRLYFCAIEIQLNTSTSATDGEQHLYAYDVTANGFGQTPTKILSRTGLRYRTSSCPNAYINGWWPCSFPGGKYTFPGRHIFGLPFIATALKAAPAAGSGGSGSSGSLVGSNASPGSSGGMSAHKERMSLFTVPQSGDLAVGRALVGGNSGGTGTQDVRVVVRENVVTTAPEGGGTVNSPGDVVDYSADKSISSAAGAITDTEIGAMQNTASVTDGDRLWVGLGSGAGNAALYGWTQSAGEFAILDDQDFPSGPSDPAPAPSTRNANRISAYVTITPASSGTITYDAAGGPNRHDELAISGTSTWSHVVANETNRVLLGFACYRRTAASMASMAFNTSESLSLVLARNQGSTSRAEMWMLKAPTATTANVVATNQGDAEDVVTGSISLHGVDQTTTIRAQGGAGGTAPTLVLTCQAGDLIVCVVSSQNEIAMTPPGGSTTRLSSPDGTGDAGLLVFTIPAADGANAITVTGDGTNSLNIVGAAFIPAVGSDTTPPANVSDLVLSEPTAGTIRAAFTASVSLDTEAYKIRYKTGADQTFSSHTDGTEFVAETACTPGEAIQEDVAGFDDDTAYTVAVFCKDDSDNWNSGNGATLSITTADTTAPSAPTVAVSESAAGAAGWSLTMPSTIDAVSYRLRRKDGLAQSFADEDDGTLVASGDADPSEVVTGTNSGLTVGGSYTFGGFAADLAGNWSAAGTDDVTLDTSDIDARITEALVQVGTVITEKMAVLTAARSSGNRAALDLAASELQAAEQAQDELQRAQAMRGRLT